MHVIATSIVAIALAAQQPRFRDAADERDRALAAEFAAAPSKSLVDPSRLGVGFDAPGRSSEKPQPTAGLGRPTRGADPDARVCF